MTLKIDKDFKQWRSQAFRDPIYYSLFVFFIIHFIISLIYLVHSFSYLRLARISITGIESIILSNILLLDSKNKNICKFLLFSILIYAIIVFDILALSYLGLSLDLKIIVIAVLAMSVNILFVFFPVIYNYIAGFLMIISIIISDRVSVDHYSIELYTIFIPAIVATTIFSSVFASVFKKIYIYQNKLKFLAITDSLTGAYNRKFMKDNITDNNCMKFSGSIIMLDIDYFKHINDSFGHPAGDAILSAFVNLVKNTIRKDDYIIRSGGEEFLIVCKDTSILDAYALAERIRETVENYDIAPKFTVSVGVTNFYEKEKFENINKRVDNLLYKSKNAGRNCVSSEQFLYKD